MNETPIERAHRALLDVAQAAKGTDVSLLWRASHGCFDAATRLSGAGEKDALMRALCGLYDVTELLAKVRERRASEAEVKRVQGVLVRRFRVAAAAYNERVSPVGQAERWRASQDDAGCCRLLESLGR